MLFYVFPILYFTMIAFIVAPVSIITNKQLESRTLATSIIVATQAVLTFCLLFFVFDIDPFGLKYAVDYLVHYNRETYQWTNIIGSCLDFYFLNK